MQRNWQNLVRDLHGHINLIPVNKVEERNFEKGSNDDIKSVPREN